ncbi:MAG: electron transfer flavoprotein subunit alpha/FixB family protein [Thermoanaerobaculia bacterium]
MSRRIWVVAQQRGGKLHRMSLETLAAAHVLASRVDGEVRGVVLSATPEPAAAELAAYALAGVLAVQHPALDPYTPGAFVAALESLIRDRQPNIVLFPHSYQSVDHVPRLAQALGGALIPEVTGFTGSPEGDDELLWRRPVLGGKLQATVRVTGGDTPVLATIQAGAFAASDAPRGSSDIETVDLSHAQIAADREILGIEDVAGDQVDLGQAPIIVGVGRGVGGADKLAPIEELARELGAEIGASRPVIDNGWLPRDRQIGSSGQTVAPKLYLAVGISGAIQHLVGMKGSRVVVAINKDPGAPIFKLAQYGVVGDLHEIVPALTAALRAARGE